MRGADLHLDTLPIVQQKDEEEYGAYRTKRPILEYYDEYVGANARPSERQAGASFFAITPLYSMRSYGMTGRFARPSRLNTMTAYSASRSRSSWTDG